MAAPATHVARVKRIQGLASELTTTVKTARQQRRRALRIAAEAIKLAQAVGADERAALRKRRASR
jgi:hypothetical protein